jgi:hypothetical protein
LKSWWSSRIRIVSLPTCGTSFRFTASSLRHQFSFHRFFGHQANRPTGAACWRIATDHRDDPLFLVSVQHLGCAGPLFLVKRAIEAGLLIAMAESANCLWGERDHLGDLRSTGSLC